MRTKIIATLGPASMDPDKMRLMVENGVRIFRLNFSHSDAAYFVDTIKTIRAIESDLAVPITVMGDLSGPKVRIGEVKGSPVQVNKGASVYLGLPEKRDASGRDFPEEVFVSLDFPELLAGLSVGMPVSLSDGMLQFKVTRVIEADSLFEMEAQNSGILTSNKGISFPGKFHPLPALTAKDRKDLHEALDVGIDAVAVSFVQTSQDIEDVKQEIKRHGTWIPVVAKLERASAVENLDAILALTDAVMVARGDLGLEMDLARLPIIQKRIIRACRHSQKGVIVATQMLLSMVKNPLPTRAETTDVANAIMDGADCVMLSEETAIGTYPVDAVMFMSRIAAEAEEYFLERIQGPYAPKKERFPGKYLAYAASILAENVETPALVCHTASGTSARLLSSRRPSQPIYALTPDPRVLRSLNFFWGVKPRLISEELPNHIDRAERFIQDNPAFEAGQSFIVTAGQPTPGQTESMTNQIKIYQK